jgi:CheY-specific phosphatase CheX
MAIDVESAATRILAAITTSLGAAAPGEVQALRSQAATLAQAISDITAQRVAGLLDDATAQLLISAQVDTAKAALQADAGIAEMSASSALQAALGSLANMVAGTVADVSAARGL